MAKIYIDKADIKSKTAWFYVLMVKAPVEIYEFNAKELEDENPLLCAPFLTDGDVKIWGSQATISYIAEKYSNFEEFGKTAGERAKFESILSWANSTLYRSVHVDLVRPQMCDEDALPGTDKDAQIEFGRNRITEHFDILETAYFQKNDFICGKEPGFIDYYIGMFLSDLETVDFDFSKWPKTSKWFKDMKSKVAEKIAQFQDHEIKSSKQG